MQTTAPTHRVASSSRDRSESAVTPILGHRRRASLHLSWQLNAAIAGILALGIAFGVLLQL